MLSRRAFLATLAASGLPRLATAHEDGEAKATSAAGGGVSLGLGVVPTTLWAPGEARDGFEVPQVETNLGDLVCEALINRATDYLAEAGLDEGMPIVAVEPNSSLHASLARGMLTRDQLGAAFDPGLSVGIWRATPRDVHALIEAALADGDALPLQAAGLEVAYSLQAAGGARVSELYVYGLSDVVDPEDGETPLYLVGSEALDTGELERLAALGTLREAVQAYLAELASAYATSIGTRCLPLIPGAKGRLIDEEADTSATWTATVYLVDEEGAPAADADVVLEIDGMDLAHATADASGLVYVELPAGGHALAAYDPASCALDYILPDEIASTRTTSDDLVYAVARTLAASPHEVYLHEMAKGQVVCPLTR